MKTSNYFNGKIKENFAKFFDNSVINRLGRKSKFIRRKPQKITAFGFITGFIRSCCTCNYTYEQWAAAAGHCSGRAVSRQALFERVNSAASVRFAQEMFTHAMGKKIAAVTDGRLLSMFKRVLLQDSTTLSLPDNLVKHYPGNVSKGKQRAVARLQCIINIKTMQWLDIALQPFTANDQSASSIVLPLLCKGDLLIRDLGYFVLPVFKQIEQQQAFYISRLRYGVVLYHIKGGVVNWKQLCKRKSPVDVMVYVGAKQKMKMRIIMLPLPQEQAAERVRKAKKDRDKRLNHDEDYYLWLHYSVFITNISAEVLTAKQAGEVYKVRWQIEIVFKSWKSGLHLQEILHKKCSNLYRVQTSIYLMLMFFCLVVQHVYMPYNKKIHKAVGKYLSLIKVCTYIWAHLFSCIQLSTAALGKELLKHCSYEVRRKRKNMTEVIRNPSP